MRLGIKSAWSRFMLLHELPEWERSCWEQELESQATSCHWLARDSLVFLICKTSQLEYWSLRISSSFKFCDNSWNPRASCMSLCRHTGQVILLSSRCIASVGTHVPQPVHTAYYSTCPVIFATNSKNRGQMLYSSGSQPCLLIKISRRPLKMPISHSGILI